MVIFQIVEIVKDAEMSSDIQKRELKNVEPQDYESLKKYFSLRHPGTCESIITDTYIWKVYYNTRYYINDYGLVWINGNKDEIFSFAPLCKNEDLKACFEDMRRYFNDVLGQKLKVYLVDEDAVKIMQLPEDKYLIEEERMYFDYVYDGDGLRNLSGKKYHKKKNHVNGFKKAYEGRYDVRELKCCDRPMINEFLKKWHDIRDIKDEYNRDDYELNGIGYVLRYCNMLKFKMFGVFVDGNLEAFSLGTYEEANSTAYIHVEKANPEIRGLYAFINQQFLVNCFPEARYVNREDDMGLEGLRRAKMSYNPIKLVKKYTVIEK